MGFSKRSREAVSTEMEAEEMDVEYSLPFVHHVKNILTGVKYTLYFAKQVGN